MIDRLGKQDRVVILTGAGISAESGLQTFRASDGLWENHRIEDVATPHAWQRGPGLVWGFCLLYTSPSPRDGTRSRMPSSA